MEVYEDDNFDKMTKIIINYYNWEKEKNSVLYKKEGDNFIDENKKYYLIDKNWINNFKNYIEYNKLIEKIQAETTNNVNKEEIIKEYLNKDLIEKKDSNSLLFNLNNNSFDAQNEEYEREIIFYLNKKHDFALEIINKKTNLALLDLYKGFNKEISGKIKKNKILFEMEIENNKIIILLFPNDDNEIYEMFFIIEKDDDSHDNLINHIEKNIDKDIFKIYNINEDKINEKGIMVHTKMFTILINKKKNDFHNLVKKVKTIYFFNNKYEKEKMENDIHKFFESLNDSNDNYKQALTVGAISSNYNPCKIIDKKWADNFLHLFNYKENMPIKDIDNNFIIKEYMKLTHNFQIVTNDNIKKGQFFIINENCFISLFPLIPELEANKNKFLDYQLYLKNKKGIIATKEDIYIFESNGDINSRYNYKLINNQIKYEFLYKMHVNNHNLEFKKEDWQKLQSNVANRCEKNNDNKLNEIKRNENLMIEKEVNALLDSLHERDKKLKIEIQNYIQKRKEFENKLKEQNNNKQIILDKKNPTIGLQNLGATCYMNATLQCLAHFVEVSEKILTWYKYSKDNIKKERKLSYAYAEVLNNLYFNNEKQYDIHSINSKYYAPTSFKELVGELNPLFKGVQANDSKDIMNFMIEKMHEELNPLGKDNTYNNNVNIIIDQTNEYQTFLYFKNEFTRNFHSILSEYLYGIQKTVTLCCYCNTMIFNFQTYNFLIFPLLEVKNYIIYNNYQNPFFNKQFTLNLIDCFKYFQKIDLFDGPNQIFCNKCQSMQNANYCNMLYNVPKILCLVLNRGKDNLDFQEKITFGNKLDLTDFVQDKTDFAVYYLIGVVVHVGDSSLSGHFFAYCRSHYSSPWYKYNDAIVTNVNENEIYTVGTPYILFYHKCQ